MSEGNDQDQLQPHSPAQQQSSETFNGIGENGSNDLGDFGKTAGGMNTDNGTGAGAADTAGSAAGATTGGGMEQEAPGYGSTGQHGYGDQSGAMGGSTGERSGDQPDTDELDDDLDGGMGASAAAGSAT